MSPNVRMTECDAGARPAKYKGKEGGGCRGRGRANRESGEGEHGLPSEQRERRGGTRVSCRQGGGRARKQREGGRQGGCRARCRANREGAARGGREERRSVVRGPALAAVGGRLRKIFTDSPQLLPVELSHPSPPMNEGGKRLLPRSYADNGGADFSVRSR